jgi:peptidyl-tRNA hydrolase, PTH1 family
MVWRRVKQAEPDWIILGLGNPGVRYAHTRHNVGWWVLDALAEGLHAAMPASRYRSQVQTARLASLQLALVKPTTFMNLSGESARQWTKQYPQARMLVIHDDLALPCGKLRLRENGSSGGHNGVQSLIDCLGHGNFLRLKLGIGAAPAGLDAADWVLDEPPAAELELLHPAVRRATQAMAPIVLGRLDEARRLISPPATETPPAAAPPDPEK